MTMYFTLGAAVGRKIGELGDNKQRNRLPQADGFDSSF
jgi:hypothetical protein